LSALALLPADVVKWLAPGRRESYLARLVASCAPEQLLLLPLELFQLLGAAQQVEVMGRVKVRQREAGKVLPIYSIVWEGGEGGGGRGSAWR
jgi:hypothetical protein